MYVLKLYIHLSCNFKIPALVATNMAADVLTSHEKHQKQKRLKIALGLLKNQVLSYKC